MKAYVSRIVLVTVGLAGVGAACGALLGGLAVLVQLFRVVPPRGYPYIFLHVGAVAGGYLGAALAPTIGWLFLLSRPALPRHRADGPWYPHRNRDQCGYPAGVVRLLCPWRLSGCRRSLVVHHSNDRRSASRGTFRYAYVKDERLTVQGKYAFHDSTVVLTYERGGDACAGALIDLNVVRHAESLSFRIRETGGDQEA